MGIPDIPVPGNIMEFHEFLMNNNNNNLQNYIHKYHNTHQQILEELKIVRYNMVEMQQEFDFIEDTLTYRHQLYQQLTYQQQTLNAKIKALQDILCQQNTAFYNLQHSLSSLNFVAHENSRHKNNNHCNQPEANNMINEDNHRHYQHSNPQSYLTPQINTYSMNQAQEESTFQEY
ncbi:hypothetical protein DPMN_144754 [Dreissena polymorpha]|uniref:Uncharacterized protein n=1 Tax=Dreissena polymorpha TaxID=45954 RepID=A0A9D4IWV3_DREPO|nr:hypothetical protein DPMN_144754 [Dreissena polymorpha]